MRKYVSTMIAAMTLVLAAMVSVTCAQGKGLAGGGRLEGPWNVRVSLVNCQTGGVIRSFDSITQFMAGGTLIDSSSGVPQALKTPGQGLWEHTTGQYYRFKFKSFTFDSAGAYTGYTVIEHAATLAHDGDSYESQGTLEVYNQFGTLVFNGCAATTATRFGF